MRTSKNVKEWLPMAAASSLACTGCVLVALSLALDTYSTLTAHTTNRYTITTRGIQSQCTKTYTNNNIFVCKNCSSWSRSIASRDFMLVHHDVMLTLTISCIVLGAIANVFSIRASCSRQPKHVYVVISFEGLSGCCALVSAILYAVKYLRTPWVAGESFFVLIGGCVALVGSLVVHCCVRDVKFYGKICCTVPASTPDYRYQRTDDVVVAL